MKVAMSVQILRVQSAEGTARVEARVVDCTAVLFERVHAALALSSFAFALHKDRQRREEVVSSKSRTLRDYGLQHGDLLFLSPVNGAVLFDQATTSAEVRHLCFSYYLRCHRPATVTIMFYSHWNLVCNFFSYYLT